MTDANRWEAVLAHDRSADGNFVYGVRSTGIYCKPSCPSRRPHRDQVRFFDAAGAAEKAGFRACLRCGREGPSAAAIAKACRMLEREPMRLADLARAVGIAAEPLRKAFVRATGVSPRRYAEDKRLARLRRELKEGTAVTDAVYEAGFGSPSRLYDPAPKLGMPARSYLRGGAGEEIVWATASSSLGRVLVARTDRGVCKIALGDDDDRLVEELRGEFPRAVLRSDPSELRGVLNDAVALADGKPARGDLPLDIRATAFQRTVWEALRRIPAGETRTYGELARELGTGPRAIARACASNRLALAVPCHRVVRGDGDAGGYRWGAPRKEALLDREKTLGRTSFAKES